jgi:hypothetical protein
MTDTPDATPRYEHHLRNLLAVIHRDGGHYATEHGIEKASEDAEAAWYARAERIDALEAELVEERQARSDEQEATLRLAASQQRYVAELAALREYKALADAADEVFTFLQDEGLDSPRVQAWQRKYDALTPQKPEEAP